MYRVKVNIVPFEMRGLILCLQVMVLLKSFNIIAFLIIDTRFKGFNEKNLSLCAFVS